VPRRLRLGLVVSDCGMTKKVEWRRRPPPQVWGLSGGEGDFRLHIPDLRFGHSVNPCKFMRYPLPDGRGLLGYPVAYGRGLLGSGFPQRAVWAEAHPTD